MKKWQMIGLLVGATFLGSTVLSGPIATAAQSVSATITGPLDGQGNVKVHEQGTANVNVTGKVAAQAVIPATAFSRSFSLPAEPVVTGPDPAGTNYAITSVSFANGGDTFAGMGLDGHFGTTSDCELFTSDFTASSGPGAFVPPHDTVSMTFPQPFVIEAKSGANSCLLAGSTNAGAVTVVGYKL